MTVSYSELIYASTQFNLLTSTDGFGVRTHTRGIPPELIERLKSRNLFFYEAGNKMLCGVFDLINNPAMVEEYPQTFAFFREKIGDQTWRVCVRTIFIGRDYGWYLEPSDQNARSGNTFTYAIFIEELSNNMVEDGLLLRYFIKNIIPQNFKNTPGNIELRSLLTNRSGKPDYLPMKQWEVSHNDLPPIVFPSADNFAALLMVVYRAVTTDQKVVVLLDEAQTQTCLTAILYCMPQFLCRLCTVLTNHHHFNLETEYRIVFLNEYYPRNIDNQIPGLTIYNYRVENPLPNTSATDTVFYQHLLRLLAKKDIAGIRNLMQGFDTILQSFDSKVSFDQLFYAWQFLINQQSSVFGFEPHVVLKQIDKYLLRVSFREKIREYIIGVLKENISKTNHVAISASLKLVDTLENLEATALKEVQIPFTNYFLEANHATILMRQDVSYKLVMPYLALENRAEDLTGFIGNNKDMQATQMDDFIVKFCLAFQHRTEDYLFWLCLDGGARSSIGIQLLKEFGSVGFFNLLEKNRFFSGLETPYRKTIFDDALRQCFTNLYHQNKDGFLDYFRSATDVWPDAVSYLDHLVKVVAQADEKEYEDIVLLLDTYGNLSGKKSLQVDQLMSLEKLLILSLKLATEASIENLKWLQETITPLEENLRGEQSKRGGETDFLNVLHKLQFMIRAMLYRNEPDHLNQYINLTPNEQFYSEYYLRFILRVTLIVWDDEEKAKIFTKMLIQKFGFSNSDNRRFLIKDGGKVGIATFIPHCMNQIIKNLNIQKNPENALANFYYTYTLALWGSAKTVVRSEDPADLFFKRERLLKEMTGYLQNLSTQNDRIGQFVLKTLLDEKSEDLIDLQQHIQTNIPINISPSFSNVFNKIKSTFKRS